MAKLTEAQKFERAVQRHKDRIAAETAAARQKTGLTADQRGVMDRLAEGESIAYSQDGDVAWFTSRRDRPVISDDELHELRLRGFIGSEPDFEDEARCYPCDVITPAGRAALAQEDDRTSKTTEIS